MATVELTAPTRPAADQSVLVRAVTVIMGTVVGLTFLFGFGNVLTLALQLGVPVWVAPLVAPAVDLSILGLLLSTRHLALHGAIYDTFGSRAGLLEAVAEELLHPIGLQGLDAVLSQTDVVRAIEDGLDEAARLYEAAGQVAEAIFALASLDPDAARAGEYLERGHWEGMQDLARRLEEQGHLNGNLTRQEAAELLWVITSFQTFGQLYRQRGLATDQVAARLKELFRAVTG